MNAMTQGFRALCEGNVRVAKFAVLALRMIRTEPDGEPSMIVGRQTPDDAPALEDEGRTVVLPLPADVPTLYACVNETGGATLMRADEY